MLTILAATLAMTYHEPLRPQFHFTAQTGWLNDPNGLVHYRGEYHLFFQHNPFGTEWGNMTWGHAVSKDLVHWTQLDEALRPDEFGTMFSGSAVVDSGNTSGLGSKPLVCLYTAAGDTNPESKGKPFVQCLAYSTDGRTFVKYAGNPVVPHLEGGNRDPKVVWHAPSRKWVMALYLDGDRYQLLGSRDLKRWDLLSTLSIEGASECPDLFELPLDGDKGKAKWVFWGGSGRYLVGSFDGNSFHAETPSIPSAFGNTGYASQTYYNDPKGRRIQFAWHNNANFPGTPWNQEMGLPTELTLVSTSDGPRLAFNPVRELASLRGKRVLGGHSRRFAVPEGLMDVNLAANLPAEGRLTLDLNGHYVVVDAAKREVQALGLTAKLPDLNGKLKLRILVDRASIEIYAQGGLLSMPLFVLPTTEERGLAVTSEGRWKIDRLDVFPMQSAWPPAKPPESILSR